MERASIATLTSDCHLAADLPLRHRERAHAQETLTLIASHPHLLSLKEYGSEEDRAASA